jgi:hypothetical protein
MAILIRSLGRLFAKPQKSVSAIEYCAQGL